VIIDNKPGGGGNIGADIVAKAAPDGLTIGIAAVATHAINPWLFSKMPYDAAKTLHLSRRCCACPTCWS
jgi:tripartite-type tricarboxylate transporter receptor subunit TctC